MRKQLASITIIFLSILNLLTIGTTISSNSICPIGNDISYNVNYYIDAINGSDGNDGISSTTPWKTISKVNSHQFNPGDTILFKKEQEWNETLEIHLSGSSQQPIIYASYGDGKKPCITTDKGLCIEIDDAEYIIVKDFELKESKKGIKIRGDTDGKINLEHLCIHNITESSSIRIENRENVTIKSCEISDCKQGGGISAGGKELFWSSLKNHHITIINSTIYNNYKNGVYIEGHHANIANNHIYSNGRSKYYHNIYLMGDDAVVEHNELSYSPDGNGFRYEGGNLTIRFNYIHDNGKHGISFWNDFPNTFKDNKIYYNLITGMDEDHWGIHINEYNGGFNEIIIHNNNIYSGDKESRGIALYDCSNVDLYNNIIAVQNRVLAVDATGSSGFSSDNNCWFSSISTPFKWHEEYGDFNDYLLLGTDNNSYFADPLFINTENNDFHLQSSSPAINAGIDLGYPLDFDAHTVPTGISSDIGAFEFQGKQGLRCIGNLIWNDMKPGGTINSSFTLENNGNPGSEIDWEITEWPQWGEWVFTPPSGENLKTDDNPIIIQVSITAPEEKHEYFDGKVKIMNTENSSDYCILSVSLVTPKNMDSSSNILLKLMEKFIERIPLLEFLFETLL